MVCTAAIIAAIFLYYISSQYNHALTYYGFPQGDLGLAMKELADIRSATRGTIGYDDEAQIQLMVEAHDDAINNLDFYLDQIEQTIVTDIGQQSYDAIIEAVDEYLKVDQKVMEMGISSVESERRNAQNVAINELAPAYTKASEAFADFMDANSILGDETQLRLETLQWILVGVIVVIVVIANVVATKIGAVIAQGISKPLSQLGKRMETFAKGDIESPFPVHEYDDEVGDMLRAVTTTTTKLSVIFNDLVTLLEYVAEGRFNIRTSCEEEYIGDYQPLL
ncbi:MAG: MCP four helix bundle domain-containing protein, partial [Alistipes sp.]|nr:MCP four helix bundle domain-containing protein [Alistipes sp.]